MALPDLTPEQRAQALEKATQARRRRAEVKNALKARSMNLSEVLELADSDEAVAKMKVAARGHEHGCRTDGRVQDRPEQARAWPRPRPAEGSRRAFRLTRSSVAHLSHD